MEEQFQHKTVESSGDTERFAKLFSGGELLEVNIDDIPPAVMQRFEGYSKMYILRDEYQPNNFTGVFVLSHNNGDRTYIAEQIKVYDQTSKATEQLAYYIEMRGDIEIGHGELRKDISEKPILDGEPFIGFIETEEQYKHQGLGARRLNMMNAFAQLRYGKPLNAGDTISDDARGMFEAMATEGEVEIIDDPTGVRRRTYRMKKIDTEEIESATHSK